MPHQSTDRFAMTVVVMGHCHFTAAQQTANASRRANNALPYKSSVSAVHNFTGNMTIHSPPNPTFSTLSKQILILFYFLLQQLLHIFLSRGCMGERSIKSNEHENG